MRSVGDVFRILSNCLFVISATGLLLLTPRPAKREPAPEPAMIRVQAAPYVAESAHELARRGRRSSDRRNGAGDGLLGASDHRLRIGH
jgi:hypothetical protein